MKTLNKLEGYKTYILSGLGILAIIASSQGWLEREALEMILAVLGLSGIAALRHGVSKKS